jgi:hypothetical protein
MKLLGRETIEAYISESGYNGGTDALSNLRPLQWENNASKGAGRLKCAVTAKGDKNGPV